MGERKPGQSFEKWLSTPEDKSVKKENIILSPDLVEKISNTVYLIHSREPQWEEAAEELSRELGADVVGVTGHRTGAGTRNYLEFQRHSDGKFFVIYGIDNNEEGRYKILVSEKKLAYQRYWDIDEYINGVKYSRYEWHDWDWLRERVNKKE